MSDRAGGARDRAAGTGDPAIGTGGPADGTSRRARWRGYLGVAVARVRYRSVEGEGNQTLLAGAGIAIAVALVLVVTSVSLGLASQEMVSAGSTDFWIVPEEGRSSVVTDVGNPQFGAVHAATRRLERRASVRYATPVLVEVVRFEGPAGDPRRVFLVGVIPGGAGRTVTGLSTDGLRPGDPHYANGSYDGPWTGQAIVSESAAATLNLSTGEEFSPATARPGAGNASFTATAIRPARRPGVAQLPVVVAHLAEVQRLTGGTDADRADQLLVDATEGTEASAFAGLYPHSRVVSREGLLAQQLAGSDLPFAMAVAAVLVAAVVGTLSVVTTVGFELVDATDERAVMAALGVSGRSLGALLATETLVTATAGGVAGILLWLAGVGAIAAVGAATGEVAVVVVRPALVPLGLLLAVGIALVATPVLLLLARTRLPEALPAR